MKFDLSRKNIITTIFILIAILGYLVIKFPSEFTEMAGKPLFTLYQAFYITMTALGLNVGARIYQNVKYAGTKRAITAPKTNPQILGFLGQLKQLLEDMGGLFANIGVAIILLILYYYGQVDFLQFLGGYFVLQAGYNGGNVDGKYIGQFGDGTA